jgi:uncharacterized membrane protein
VSYGFGKSLTGRLGAAALAAVMSATIGTAVQAMEVGETLTGYAELNGRQVPLPEGEWTVAGVADNSVSGVAGAFGVIRNAVLLQLNGERVRGIVEVNTNAISVTQGWGTTDACLRDGALAKLNLYRTAIDGFCFFVAETKRDAALGGTDAWRQAQTMATERGFTLPAEWMTVGFRISNRHDILDARYHFDGLELGALAPEQTDWTPETVVDDPKKYAVVTDLNAWAGLSSELFESGMRGRLADQLKGNAIPQPLAVVEDGSVETDAIGRASKASRKRALQTLAADGVIREDDLRSYFEAVDNVAPPPTLEDYYQTLVAKTISYNLFRVSVDYLLAFIVTVNAAVSGYITAAIVVTHSMAQIANDMAWDSYIAGQRRSGAELVEFGYIAQPTLKPQS